MSISSVGSTVVGQNLNITCTVRFVDGLVGNLTIKWDKIDDVSNFEDLNLTQVRVTDGAVTNVTLIMEPVLFEYRGMYMCLAIYNTLENADSGSNSIDTNLTVICKFIVINENDSY